jgi:ESS family glutamate:Na+ symporter
MILANALIRLIKPLRKLLIPAPVLGGFLLLAFLAIWSRITGGSIIAPSTMEMLTFHGLGLGCAALALKSEEKEKNVKAQREIFNSALVTTSTYLIQAVTGLAISFALSYVIRCWPASGMLVPMGYGQGPGQAYNWGHTYEMSWGFENGTSFGLTVSAMGFIACSIGGVIYLNVMRRKRNPKVLRHISAEDEEEVLLPGTLFGKNEIPLSGSMDKLSVQFGLTFITYFIAYTITSILSKLCDMSGVNLLTSTVKPLFWGFNFIFATLGGIFVRKFLGSLYRSGAIKKRYTNNMMLDRVSGLMFDLMIVASIGAINLSAFRHGEFVIPMIVMCLVAAVASYFYVDHVCRKLFPDYNDESFLALYGMLTGVVGTGVILLREIDPRFETPACKNLVFQTLWTCLMGFPLLLFMGFVARSTTWTVITLSVNIVMFVFFYSIIRMNSRKIARERGETAGKSPPSQ